MPNRNPSAFAILQRVSEQFLNRELKRDEVIRLRRAISQHLVPLVDHERKVFVLGSYGDEEKSRVIQVKTLLSTLYRYQGSSRARVYLMDDIPGDEIWVNLDVKFRLLADVADTLVGITENDRGGFVFEQGIIASNQGYREKILLLKREYENAEVESEHFSAMQSAGLFRRLEDDDRLFRWGDSGELIEATEDLFRHMEREEQ